MHNKVVVFDLDDTLYKEIDFLKSAYKHIAYLVSNENALKDEVYETMIKTYQQGGNAFETVVNDYRIRLFDVNWMLSVYRHHRPHILLDNDTKDTLNWMKTNGITMGIITDGRLLQQQNKIEALGLGDYMEADDIIINDVAERHKPDRRSFKAFMDKYGKNIEYWYIADNTNKDFLAPNELGWNTACLMDDGRNIHKQDFTRDVKFLPKHKITKMSDLIAFV